MQLSSRPPRTGRDLPLLCVKEKAFLHHKQLLLVLDNFEHLLLAAPLLAELLSACPQIKIVVTSRARLHIEGEYVFVVPPLAVPDVQHLPDHEALGQVASVAYFVQYVQAIQPEFQLTEDNAPFIAEICARLEGLPLAMELAATRSRVLLPQALLTRLEDRLEILTGGRQDAPVRQQTLRNSISWSYDLLSAEEQRLLRWLSVFTDGCTLQAAEEIVTALGGLSIPVLELLSPVHVRYYSISSSPLVEKDRCSITVGVVRAPAKSGHGTFEGMCSTYLSEREVGDVVYAFVQDTKSRFRLPENPATPMIMIGPGTGLAPFRGFLQERAALKAQGKEVGKSLLYFGCRHPEQDLIYEDELQTFVEQGVTDLSLAFSRLNGKKTYVQDKIKQDREKVWQLLEEGAIIYICGDASQMAPAVRKAFAAIYQEKMGAREQEAKQWLDGLTEEKRYLVDVWGM